MQIRNLVLSICAAALVPAATAAYVVPLTATTVNDRAMLDRLRGNSGITLQWIGWEERGHLTVRDANGLIEILGSQAQRGGPGRLEIDGIVTRIDRDRFDFLGRIEIIDSPEAGRNCLREGPATFAITQNRRYWRLQEMEVCDGLTDYVDIYL